MGLTGTDNNIASADSNGAKDKRVLIFATTAYMIERFNMMNIRMLQDMGYTVDAACNFEYGNPMSSESLESFRRRLSELKVESIQLPVNRRIFDIRNNGAAFIRTLRLLRSRKYSFVHCHTPVGSVVARLACRLTGTRVIYTAHGFHFFDGAPRINWLLYYPVEKLFSYITDVLITINREDYERAGKSFHMKRLEYVPGIGIDVEKFNVSRELRTAYRREIRGELHIDDSTMLFLSVGELSKRKNHISVLRAIAADADHSENASSRSYCFAVAGTGAYRDYLQQYIDEHQLQDRVRLIGYREDTLKLYCAADAFLFPSYQEGLSAALMEAMACRLPVAAGRIRGNTDLIDAEGGILFEVGREPEHIEADSGADVQHIQAAVRRLMSLTREQLEAMGTYNYNKVREGFGTDTVSRRLHDIYADLG